MTGRAPQPSQKQPAQRRKRKTALLVDRPLPNPVMPWSALPLLPGGAPTGGGILDDGFIQRLAALVLGVEPARYESAFDALCERLGIRKGPEVATFIAVAIKLAKEQPEFSEKRGRGRPSLGNFSPSVAYKRTQAVRKLRREKEAEGVAGPLRDKALTKELVDSRHQFFRSGNTRTLAASVSRGNTQWRELQRRYERQLEQLRTEERRLERERRKADAAHKRSMKLFTEKGGGLLSVRFGQALSGSTKSDD